MPLEPEHLVGRAATCSLCIIEKYISVQHAAFRYTGSSWAVRDLGSTNGTYVDGTRLEPGQEKPLVATRSTISFGRRTPEWVFVDDGAPQIMAIPLDGGPAILLDSELLVLPSSDDPQVTIYRSAEGTWVLEAPDALVAIANRQVFPVGSRLFRFSCPEAIYKTSLNSTGLDGGLSSLTLKFEVTRDEEHVKLTVNADGREFDLGDRGHNYLLLTLARRRLDDATERQPETACGWIYQDVFAHDPSMAGSQLNLNVCRIRKQFATLGLADSAQIIERRPRTKQMRIGTSRISIVYV